MRKFLCYDTNDAASGKINVDSRGMLKPVVQSDWNQNDDTQPDYVKNRPFYTGDPVETVLVEGSTVTFSENGGLYIARFPSTFEATVGHTYKVFWDGIVYECTCADMSEAYVIGNRSILGIGSDTGEPFIIAIFNGEGIQIMTADTSASHTVSISEMVVPVVKIDKKYLVQPDWNQNDGTAADYVKNRPFYSETGNVTVENAVGLVDLKRFPVFAVGDTVTVNVDGVEHSQVAYEDEGSPIIGDTHSSLENGEGQLGWQIYVDGDVVGFFAIAPHTVSYLGIDYHHKIDPKYLPMSMPFKPAGKSYLTFSSPNSFTLAVNDATKHWNGTLEYFAPDKTWTTWGGTSALSAVANNGGYVLYLRGTGNTVITGLNLNYRWILTGSDIACVGNVENLLDYATVESGAHPTLAKNCYTHMFSGCTGLTQAPSLPATTLADSCYTGMFYGCTGLTQAPALPATTLASGCYDNMFYGCTGLTQAPALPASTLASGCYQNMFYGCTGLTQASALPASTLASGCYSYMFSGCTSLTQTPALPATTLANSCYTGMFSGCTSLTQTPTLPATTLANSCYSEMFSGCTSLTQTPALPATTLADSCYTGMFRGCTSLTQAPALPAITLANSCYMEMFSGCASLTQAPALPATTLMNYCYNNMFRGCARLKLSSTQTGEYTQEYRIPSSGTGTTATRALDAMFTSTGGTFTEKPVINTTYYLSSDNMIVRETEIATLNGYVGAMIDSAEYIIPSSTSGSTKKFKITVDDSGTITATEV